MTHYRLAVDTIAPTNLKIETASTSQASNPEQVLIVTATEENSGIAGYIIKIDDQEAFTYNNEAGDGIITLPVLAPGYHAIIVEAFDAAGNSVIGSHSVTIEAFDRPQFTDVPTTMTANVIPVIRGITRPESVVTLFFNRLGSEPNQYEIMADAEGVFTFIPEGELYSGVYELSAKAVDQYGAQSELSDIKRIAVQEPGYIRIGSQVVNAMSVIVPLVLLVLLFMFGIWYLLFVFRRYRSAIQVESVEALDILHREFSQLQATVRSHEAALQQSRKTKKLTKAETAMIAAVDAALVESQQKVEKEINDVTRLAEE